MSVWPVHTLDDARRVDPILVEALEGVSLDFFEPASPNVGWEPQRTPLTGGGEVRLVANKPVSRAWHAVFIKVFRAAAHEQFGWGGPRPWFRITEQVPRAGPVELGVELGDTEADRREVVELVNVATETANALVPRAAENCRREHEQLAAELGLARPRVGF